MAQTSISVPGINYAFPSKIGGTGTGVKIFPSLLTPTLPAVLQTAYTMQGQLFQITASGTMFLHGTSPTIIPTLQFGSSLTPGSNTTVSALTTAQLFPSVGANYPWSCQINLQGDNNSGIIQVFTTFWAANNVLSSTFTNTAITGVNWLGAFSDGINLSPVLPGFVFGLNFGVSDALNTAALYQYNIEF